MGEPIRKRKKIKITPESKIFTVEKCWNRSRKKMKTKTVINMINQKMRISLLGFLGTREGTVPMGRDNSGSLRVLVNRATVQVLAKKNVGNVKNTIKKIKKIKE